MGKIPNYGMTDFLVRSLEGRRFVITGAGRGLGRALAIVAAAHGARVVLLGRDSAALNETAQSIASHSTTAPSTFVCDLNSHQSISQACQRVLEADPVVDVLINNAAPYSHGTLAKLSEASILETVQATVTGTILVTKGLLPGLLASRAADIVTIVSTAGLPRTPRDGQASAAFHAAKHGQSGFSDRLSAELKPQGIRVAAIYPPYFQDTDPLGADWGLDRNPASGDVMTTREIVAAVLFIIGAPRVMVVPTMILDNLGSPC